MVGGGGGVKTNVSVLLNHHVPTHEEGCSRSRNELLFPPLVACVYTFLAAAKFFIILV